jgi:catechol 2,3-dioxygenase-like lactoylglutathione lyase family enzyme
MSEITAIRHIGFRVKNIARALKLYRDVLGFEVMTRNTVPKKFINNWLSSYSDLEYVKLKLPGEKTLLELTCLSAYAFPYNFFYNFSTLGHVALTVRDIDRLHTKLVKLDFFCHQSPSLDPEGRNKVMFCRDDDGNLIELVEPVIKKRS